MARIIRWKKNLTVHRGVRFERYYRRYKDITNCTYVGQVRDKETNALIFLFSFSKDTSTYATKGYSTLCYYVDIADDETLGTFKWDVVETDGGVERLIIGGDNIVVLDSVST